MRFAVVAGGLLVRVRHGGMPPVDAAARARRRRVLGAERVAVGARRPVPALESGVERAAPRRERALIQARGGVYIGVGPEQNFTYIARLRPSTAFIIDIRRENRSLHLLYKALFEISRDRADFVSRLFSPARPAGRMSNARGCSRSSPLNRRPRSCANARSRSSANAWSVPTASRCRRTISTGSSKPCTPSSGTDPTSTSGARGPALPTPSGRRTGG